MVKRLKKDARCISQCADQQTCSVVTGWLLQFLCATLVVILSTATVACGPAQPTEGPESTPTPSPSATASPTAEPSPTPTATPTPTPSPLSSAQIFDLVSPAVAFVDTPTGTGSGVLIEGGYILTNFHVVWPFESLRVVFPDGSEHLDTPLLSWDPLGDFAVVGPVETDIAPLELADGEDLPIGSDTFLIGYPGEVDEFPEPTITRGLISRMREWKPNAVTYFQTDATVGRGQSGGLLVSDRGEVIGISSVSFSDAGFGLVASAADLGQLIEDLIAGEDPTGIGFRRIPLSGGQKGYYHLNPSHEWDGELFIINEPAGTEVEITAFNEKDDIAFVVRDVAGGVPLAVDDRFVGIESGTFDTELDAPYFVDLFKYTFLATYQPVSIEANCDLAQYVDLDDGRSLAIGKTVNGNLDYPGDIDFFKIVLDQGEEAHILADSILVDPLLLIGRPGDDEEQLVSDDDTGGGIFGLSAELTFQAPQSGIYLIIVMDALESNVGGYSMRLTEPDADSPTPMAPEPTATVIATDLGPMATYESTTGLFTIQYPAMWTDDPALTAQWGMMCELATACFVGDSVLAIAEEDLTGIEISTAAEYVDLYLESMDQMGTDVRLVSREDLITADGLEGQVITLDFAGLMQAKRLVLLHEGQAFNATYLILDEERDSLLEIADYSFSTITATE